MGGGGDEVMSGTREGEVVSGVWEGEMSVIYVEGCMHEFLMADQRLYCARHNLPLVQPMHCATLYSN